MPRRVTHATPDPETPVKKCIDLLPPTKCDARPNYDFLPVGDDSPIAGVVTIRCGRTSAAYRIEEFATGWDGRGFYFAKLTAGSDATEEGYSVFCGRNEQDRECNCRGFQAHGNCKHVATAISLILNGWI